MALPLPNLSFTGGEAKSGVEGDATSGGVWSGGGKTRVNIFAPDAGAIGVAADSAGGAAVPSWVWYGLAGAAVVGVGLVIWRARR